ncbi:MAG TPA: hypothetical protein IAC95_01950 [Candidatus Fimimonas gallinarum]|uniref:Uncharacterized protein n=1 Tax=Candidatus Fimimonas gallinarum TaxID=2840821 RepID=A0A9D1E350_9BACT|nr:hypothetical protein [Candidatus Fimimonas gallinarum]
MTNFTISATLEENKDLTITKTAPQNQGENETSCILVTVPHSLVSGYEFYLEFLCPSNKKYLSPVLSKYEETETGVVYDCLIPACVLGEEGLVMFQLVARSDMDKSVVLKSNFSRKTSFFVRPSVNATEKTLRIDDYFASMQEKVDGFEEQLNTAQLNISNKVSFKKQSLSETEKQQARENIGAGTSNFSGNYDDLEDKPDIPQKTVSFQAQSLSDAEKQQARQNIGAGTSNFSGNYDDLSNKPTVPQGAVLYNQQTLNDDQKAQARENIGAGTSNFSGSYNDLTDKPAGGGGVTSWGNATGDIVLGDGFYFNDDNKAETLISGTYFSNIIAPNSNYAIAPIYPAVIFMRIQLDSTYSSELVITIKSQGVDREYRVPVPSNAMNFCASIYKDHLATSIRGTFFDSDNVKTGENVELFGTISFREPIRICVSSHDSAGLFMTYYVIYKNDSTI